MNTEEQLRIRDFAKIFDLSPRTIEGWVASRKIAYFRVSARSIRIPASEVERLKKEGFVPAKAVEQA